MWSRDTRQTEEYDTDSTDGGATRPFELAQEGVVAPQHFEPVANSQVTTESADGNRPRPKANAGRGCCDGGACTVSSSRNLAFGVVFTWVSGLLSQAIGQISGVHRYQHWVAVEA